MSDVLFLRRADDGRTELLAPALSEREWQVGRSHRRRLLAALAPAAPPPWWLRWWNGIANTWRRRRGRAA